MRYPASEKLEIIRLVENSPLSARRTLQKFGIPRSTFNRWSTSGVSLSEPPPRPHVARHGPLHIGRAGFADLLS